MPLQDTIEPFTELSQFQIDPASIQLLGYQYCLKYGVVVLGRVDLQDSDPVTIGMLDPSQELIITELSSVLRRPVNPVRLNAFEIRRAVERGFGHEVMDGDQIRVNLPLAKALRFDPDAPVTAVLNEILGRAVDLGASDVHLETYEDDVDVRLRIDGVLHQLATPLSRANIAEAVSRLKILGGLDIAERRVAQDGRIMATIEGINPRRVIDFRLSVVPGPFGEDAVLRVLEGSMPTLSLESLGLQAQIRTQLMRLSQNPEGLLLVTGPTGSGKTTTLYSILNQIKSAQQKILTVEDPIEYYCEKVVQKQVTGQMSFADYARAFMRQNPNVILIGEIRDEETADVAMRAAQTGHLVFSTLHAGGSVRTISRLRTLGVEQNVIANSLLGSLAQRLVRRLCPHCRRETCAANVEGAERFGLDPDTPLMEAQGCPRCADTGYKGRVGIFELFTPDDSIADLIASDEPIHRIRRYAEAQGMLSLVEDGLQKALDGDTTLGEILRMVPYRIIERYFQAAGPAR